MGWRDRRARRAIEEPVRGEFRVSGQYFAHPNSSSYRQVLTGVLSGPGIPPTPGEHLDDTRGRRIGHDVLPALIDRTDPTRFVILWDEVGVPDFRDQARERAREQARQAATGTRPAAPEVYVLGDPGSGPVPDWARRALDDLVTGPPGSPFHADGPPLVVDLTAGHLSAADADRLAHVGEPATAVLTEVAEVAVPAYALPGPTASLCDLTLQVSRRDGTVYTARTRLGFRDAHRRAAVAVLGAVLPVRVDPADPSRVAVDVAAFDQGRR